MKIIRVTEEYVVIGTDDGQALQIKKSELDFEAKIGMEVEKYVSGNEIIIVQKQPEKAEKEYADKETNGQTTLSGTSGQAPVINVINNNTMGSRPNIAPPAPKPVTVVNKLAYILLALFLGGLGMHKFYAGKSIGILYILFCWTFIPSAVALIEAIFACFQPADAKGRIVV